MKCDELEIKYVGYGMGFYPTEEVDEAIAELKKEKEYTITQIAEVINAQEREIAKIERNTTKDITKKGMKDLKTKYLQKVELITKRNKKKVLQES